ncbi:MULTISPECIES: hypothetical protein [Ramlibacter]|uniref:Uncharacterized protein n=1 Tax=Ramlibacter pinisoli TaxID=2682844 RepID=A0A6N8J2W3_9BURK|nr:MULTISPECIES: hypothetical protein [Ramlibacter]MBA2962614.1 hypothetical protein [Ramlibacter sp. CGMCC 1.13660]MVQ32556.1 hypothetical protein [Ramlibacter pinisoli]
MKRLVCCGACLDELMLQEGAGRPQRPAPLEGVRNHHLPFEIPHRAFGFVPPLKLLIHYRPAGLRTFMASASLSLASAFRCFNSANNSSPGGSFRVRSNCCHALASRRSVSRAAASALFQALKASFVWPDMSLAPHAFVKRSSLHVAR